MTSIIKQHQSSAPAALNFFDLSQFEALQKISTLFSNSELVPDMYRTSEKVPAEKAQANCMIALSLAQRIGADPLMVMQNLVIIHGRPTWSSKFLIATVNTCGRFEPLKYRAVNKGKIGTLKIRSYIDKLKPGTSQKEKAEILTDFDATNIDEIEMEAFTKDKVTGEELVGSKVSVSMAIQEGWYTKNGSKWVTMPEKMLKYRAASFWVNEFAPEISMGMKTDDEAIDIGATEDIDYTDVTNKQVQSEINAKANTKPLTFDDDKASNQQQNIEPQTQKEPEGKTPQSSAMAPNTDFDKQSDKQNQPGSNTPEIGF